MLTFNNRIGLTVEDTAVIRERRAAEWKAAFATNPSLPELNTDEETPAGQIIDGEVALISQKDSDMLYLARMFDPATADGMWQDALAQVYFIKRHRAQPTYVTCVARGLYGTIIPYGAIVQDVSGNTFINTSPAVIGQNGTVDIIVRCSVWGAIEVGSNTVNKIITTVPGWDTVNNPAPGVTGNIEETQAEFENRRYESVARNSHGAAASVFGAIANLPNVIACRVLENTTCEWITRFGVEIAPHSLYISVYGGEESDIAKAIYNKIDGGCGTTGTTELIYLPGVEDNDQDGAFYTYYIVRPRPTAVGINVQIRQTKDTPSTIIQNVKSAVIANFHGEMSGFARVKMATTLYSSRFYEAVLNAGVQDLEKIKVSYPAGSSLRDSVEIPANQMPVLSENDIAVNILNF